MKKLLAIFLAALTVVLLFASCDKDEKPADDLEIPSGPVEIDDSYTGPWQGFTSSFTRQGGNQYDNANLLVKYLANGVLLFEFDIMEGSESEDESHSLRIPGTMLANETDHTAVFEQYNAEGEVMFTINFTLAEDGQELTVTHTGDIPMNPDGTYEWLDAYVECSEGTARALIENLPTAVTSLNANLGAYTISYPEEYVLNYFYPVTATFDDTGKALAEFVVTGDLSAVWRLDTEGGVPALIFGEAQTMLDQVTWLEPNEDEEPAAVPLLTVSMEGGTLIEPGKSAKLKLEAPYAFPVSFENLLVTDDAVLTVAKNGAVNALKAGTATITGNVVIADGKRGFMIDVTVGKEGDEPPEAQTEPGKAPADISWWGQYKSEDGMSLLGITNYNGKSFYFTLMGPGKNDEGAAAVYPDDPEKAEMLPYVFTYQSEDHITITGGDFAGEYHYVDPADVALG